MPPRLHPGPGIAALTRKADNTWLDELPARWVAPVPPGYDQAERTLADLMLQLSTVGEAVQAARRAGDIGKLQELRSLELVLPDAIEQASATFLALRVEHLEASVALIRPHLARLRAERDEKKREARRALEQSRLISLALHRCDLHRDALNKDIAEARRQSGTPARAPAAETPPWIAAIIQGRGGDR